MIITIIIIFSLDPNHTTSGLETTTDPKYSAHLAQICEAWSFCEKNSESVEVVYINKELGETVLTQVHFPFDPKVHG